MSDDHLSNEISVSAELTPTGVSAKAKSRIFSALDRVIGGAIDRFTPKLEGPAALARSQNAREVRLNDALTDKMVEMIHADPAIAERALEQHLSSIGRRQENKEAVVTLALEDLSHNPPTDEQSESGPEQLDEDFLGRFERFAEDATSSQLRERWGRVLAAEVRQPGTFSAKVMRVVDELDAPTAALFERICEFRIGNCIPTAILPEVEYMDQTRLVSAGLIVDPGLGQFRVGTDVKDGSGTTLKVIPFGIASLGIVALEDFKYPKAKRPPVKDHQGRPGAPIWLLTDVGHAISSILPNNEIQAFDRFIDCVAEYLAPGEVRDYRPVPGGSGLMPVRSISRPASSPAEAD